MRIKAKKSVNYNKNKNISSKFYKTDSNEK